MTPTADYRLKREGDKVTLQRKYALTTWPHPQREKGEETTTFHWVDQPEA